MSTLNRDHQLLLAELSARGVSTSVELQAALRKSQPTLSRLLGELSSQVLSLGRGRNTRYGVAQPIMGQAAQQPLWWIEESGNPRRLGTLSLLAGGVLHVEAEGFDSTTRGRLPWFLAPLRPQGFLGRLVAQRLAPSGLAANPETWGVEATLFAALHLHDAPGAVVLGEPSPPAAHHPVPLALRDMASAFDELAANVASTLPAGSSAGGEQPKFVALMESGEHVLVKFTPPRGTPFGDRWHDLLHAEALASEVLARHGVRVAASKVIESEQRTYLVSSRFDRVAASGRRHAVAVGAVHEEFVPGSYSNWGATCEALVRQGRLDATAGDQATALLRFGRLIGNTDMHSGNLSLFVELATLGKAAFTLAPVYDMLPMRYRPDPMQGGAADYSAFEPDPVCLASGARGPAADFWRDLSGHRAVSSPLRKVAGEMVRRLS